MVMIMRPTDQVNFNDDKVSVPPVRDYGFDRLHFSEGDNSMSDRLISLLKNQFIPSWSSDPYQDNNVVDCPFFNKYQNDEMGNTFW